MVKCYRTMKSKDPVKAESTDKESFPYFRAGMNLRTFKQDVHYFLMTKSCIRVATGKLAPPEEKDKAELWYWDRLEAYNNMVERYKGYLAKCLPDKMKDAIIGDSEDPVKIHARFMSYGMDEGFTTSSTLRSQFYDLKCYYPIHEFCNEIISIQSRHNSVCVRGHISDQEVIARLLHEIPAKPGQKYHSIAQDIQKDLGKEEAELLNVVRSEPDRDIDEIIKEYQTGHRLTSLNEVVDKLVAYSTQFPDSDNDTSSEEEDNINVATEPEVTPDISKKINELTDKVSSLALMVQHAPEYHPPQQQNRFQHRGGRGRGRGPNNRYNPSRNKGSANCPHCNSTLHTLYNCHDYKVYLVNESRKSNIQIDTASNTSGATDDMSDTAAVAIIPEPKSSASMNSAITTLW